MAVIGEQVDLGVDDGVLGDVAGALEQGGAHRRALVLVHLIVEPVIAPGQGIGGPVGPFVGIGARGGAHGVPRGDREQPFLGAGDHLCVLGDKAADGQMADRVKLFLAIDVGLAPDRRDAGVVRVSDRLGHDLAVHPRQDRFLVEGRPGAMVRVFGDGLAEGVKVFGPENEPRVRHVATLVAGVAAGQGRGRKIGGEREAAALAPGGRGRALVGVPDGVGPVIGRPVRAPRRG